MLLGDVNQIWTRGMGDRLGVSSLDFISRNLVTELARHTVTRPGKYSDTHHGPWKANRTSYIEYELWITNEREALVLFQW